MCRVETGTWSVVLYCSASGVCCPAGGVEGLCSLWAPLRRYGTAC